MIQIFTNVNTRRHYDIRGNQFSDGMPQIFYQNNEQVRWQLCSDTPDITDSDYFASSWTVYDELSSISGINAYLTADDNYIKRIQGSLTSNIPAGALTSLTATIIDATKTTIAPTGTVGLVDDEGNTEILEYTSRSIGEGNVVTFAFPDDTTVTGSYDLGGEMNVNESVMMQAVMDYTLSDASSGLFVFTLVADSPKLRNYLTYTDVSNLAVMGLELAIFKTDADTGDIQDIERFVVDSFSVRTGMIETIVGVQIAPQRQSEVITLVHTMLAYGFDVQYSVDGSTEWHDAPQVTADAFIRFRSSAGGGGWSVSVGLPAAIDAYDVWLSEGHTGTAQDFLDSLVGANGTNAYLYRAWASDDEGTGFSLTSSDSLPYIAEMQSTTPYDADPTLSDFTDGGAIWRKWKGDDGVGTYTYRAYASDDTGSNFSLTASDSLPYTAIVTSNTAMLNDPPIKDDFTSAGAVWVRWKGQNGTSTYTKVAWASTESGDDFSLTPSFVLKYRAEIQLTTDIDTPTLTDFQTAGATWVQVIGEDGLNAYELWLEEGNEGTAAEFQQSLIGSDMFTYVAFATDQYGSGFIAYSTSESIESLTEDHKYRAEIHLTSEYTSTVNLAFFTANSAVWQKWIGDNATITVGTVTTAEAGTSALVSNVGSSTNAVLDFVIPKGDKGDGLKIDVARQLSDRVDYDAAQQGFVFADTEVFTDESGAKYTNLYIKNSNAQCDWSDPVAHYAGAQGSAGTISIGAVSSIDYSNPTAASVQNVGTPEAAILNFTLKTGPTGPAGENAEVLPPFEFTVDDLVGFGLNITGVKPISSVQLYDANGKGVEVEASDSESTDKCRVLYDYDGNDTTIYFGSDLSNTYDWANIIRMPPYLGRICFAQGVQSQSPFEIWRDEYGDENSTSADYLAWLRQEGGTLTISEVDESNIATILTVNLPVALEYGDHIYPLERATYWRVTGGYNIDMTAYLGYESLGAFGDSWTVYFNGGQKGDVGPSGSLGIGTVITGASGSMATVTNVGTSTAAVLDFTIPRGVPGTTPTIGIGSVTTGQPGTSASVANVGTNTNVVLNFSIPAGLRLANAYEEIESSDLVSGNIEIDDDILPIVLATGAGSFYHIADGTLTHDSANSKYIIDPVPYQQLDNYTSFTGTWKVFFAGGVAGDDGYGFALPEPYVAETTYQPQSETNTNVAIVTHQNSSWVFIGTLSSTGNAPPTLPTTENDYWRLVAIKGTDSILAEYAGEWDDVTTYDLTQSARHAGAIWKSLAVTNLDHEPPADPFTTTANDYWTLLVRDGAAVSVGTITTGDAGTSASVTNAGTNSNVVLNFTIPKGAQGDSATIEVGTVTTVESSVGASVNNSGSTSAAVLDFNIPKGAGATVEIGTTTTIAAGSVASVTNVGTATNAVLNFSIPQGIAGNAATVSIGTITTVDDDELADVSNAGNSTNAILNFSIPKGAVGPANTLSIGTVTTGIAGSSAAASITGTAPTQTLNLTIPTGANGAAAGIAVGTVITGATGTDATVTNVGTSSNAVFNFKIPRGATGATGTLTEAIVYADDTPHTYLQVVTFGEPASLYQCISSSGASIGESPTTASAKWRLVAEHGEPGADGNIVQIIGVWNSETSYTIVDNVQQAVRVDGGVFVTKIANNLNHEPPSVAVAEDDYWILLFADNAVMGANCVLSPTPPVDVYDGLIWCQQESGDTVANMNISPINIVEQSSEPSAPDDGTVWIEES